MNLNNLFSVFGVVSVISSVFLIWYSFQRQMCAAMGGTAGANCAPNMVYLVPGLLVALVGVAFIALMKDIVGGELSGGFAPLVGRSVSG